MPKTRRKFDAGFKSGVALEAVRGERTINEIASEYGIHPNQVSQWKAQLLENLPRIFASKGEKSAENSMIKKERDELHRHIGQLKVEIDWLKKKTNPFHRDQTWHD